MRARRLRAPAVILLAAAVLSGAGCGSRSAALDRRDEDHPLMRRALARKQANDVDDAIRLYHEALAHRPDLARAHLELGLLYDQKKEDYVRAVHHYERYIEMRPATEKKDYIEGLVRYARLSFAASLPDRPSGSVQRIADLMKENRLLRERVSELLQELDEERTKVRTLASGAGTAGGPPAPAPGPAGGAPAGAAAALAPPRPDPPLPPDPARTYAVRPGDTLSTIAAAVYGDRRAWERIYEANRDQLAQPGSLKPGQVLVIPKQREGDAP
jgi:tetratricopeptide (TPR) repeat protein